MEITSEVIETPHGKYTFVPPIIEQLQESTHRGENISRFLNEGPTSVAAPKAYDELAELLLGKFTRRIALYIPFWVIARAPTNFVAAYKDAWKRLLFVADVRENFHLGDCFELDARRGGESEYVVKATHLTPWLIKYGILSQEDLVEIIKDIPRSSIIISQGFKEALPVVHQASPSTISRNTWDELDRLLRDVPDRVPLRPLYVSKRRTEWLKEMATKSFPPLATPGANLSGPFSTNLDLGHLRNLADSLAKDQIVLIGGSRLKGYANISSDYDVLDYDAISGGNTVRNWDYQIGSPHAAHIYFNYAWLTRRSATELSVIIQRIYGLYARDYGHLERHLERIEADLLLYRLLHKGYARFNRLAEFRTGNLLSIDGDCAFYDDGYRTIATEIFAKYIHIPD